MCLTIGPRGVRILFPTKASCRMEIEIASGIYVLRGGIETHIYASGSIILLYRIPIYYK